MIAYIVQCQCPRRGLTCYLISMLLSQTGSYMNQIQRNHISTPTSQTWSYS
ncbi:hypothetical protein F383_38444 [Gossypium arboreum]|uniref:Uncharacterized protein n=1 Tax=Gossypium arboreum TaxID=29729 RepID=A0A0B0MGV9_GOSAR|nr:hypothetical protein F383_38444 [Gossypium arboreum]